MNEKDLKNKETKTETKIKTNFELRKEKALKLQKRVFKIMEEIYEIKIMDKQGNFDFDNYIEEISYSFYCLKQIREQMYSEDDGPFIPTLSIKGLQILENMKNGTYKEGDEE